MRRIILSMGGALALYAIAGLATPATACRYSRSIFTAAPVGTDMSGQVRVRVERGLMIRGRLAAVRATVLGDADMARRGDSIVIVVPRDDAGNCYYGGLADPETIGPDGALQGYVILGTRRAPSDAFPSWLTSDGDRLQYEAFTQGRLRGRWVRPRFTAGAELSE